MNSFLVKQFILFDSASILYLLNVYPNDGSLNFCFFIFFSFEFYFHYFGYLQGIFYFFFLLQKIYLIFSSYFLILNQNPLIFDDINIRTRIIHRCYIVIKKISFLDYSWMSFYNFSWFYCIIWNYIIWY